MSNQLEKLLECHYDGGDETKDEDALADVTVEEGQQRPQGETSGPSRDVMEGIQDQLEKINMDLTMLQRQQRQGGGNKFKTRMSSSQTTVGLPLVQETQAQAWEPIYQGNCKFCNQMSKAIAVQEKVVDEKERDIIQHHEMIQKMATKMSRLKDRIDTLENENNLLRKCQKCQNEQHLQKDCQQNDLMASFEASNQNREVTD